MVQHCAAQEGHDCGSSRRPVAVITGGTSGTGAHFCGIAGLVRDKEVPVYAAASVGRVIEQTARAKRERWSPDLRRGVAGWRWRATPPGAPHPPRARAPSRPWSARTGWPGNSPRRTETTGSPSPLPGQPPRPGPHDAADRSGVRLMVPQDRRRQMGSRRLRPAAADAGDRGGGTLCAGPGGFARCRSTPRPAEAALGNETWRKDVATTQIGKDPHAARPPCDGASAKRLPRSIQN